MTNSKQDRPATSRPKSNPQSGTERQKRYRAGKTMRSIDLPEEVLAQVRALRERTGLTTAILFARSLEAFEAAITKSLRQSTSTSHGKRARNIKDIECAMSPGDDFRNTSSQQRKKPATERLGAAVLKAGARARPPTGSHAREPRQAKVEVSTKSMKHSKSTERQMDMFRPKPSDAGDRH